jgi:hypothetical protein
MRVAGTRRRSTHWLPHKNCELLDVGAVSENGRKGLQVAGSDEVSQFVCDVSSSRELFRPPDVWARSARLADELALDLEFLDLSTPSKDLVDHAHDRAGPLTDEQVTAICNQA